MTLNRFYSKTLYNNKMSELIGKEENKPGENEIVSFSDKESDLLSVEPFELEGFNSNG